MTERKDFMCKGGEFRSARKHFRVSVICTMTAPCGPMWAMAQHGKEVVDVQNGGQDLFDEIGEAKMLHNEDKRNFA